MSDVHRECVIDHSVYNYLSIAAQDATPQQIAAGLAPVWSPQWRDEPLSAAEVDAAGDRLARAGLIQRSGGYLVIPVRDPNGRGPVVEKTEDRKRLVRQ